MKRPPYTKAHYRLRDALVGALIAVWAIWLMLVLVLAN